MTKKLDFLGLWHRITRRAKSQIQDGFMVLASGFLRIRGSKSGVVLKDQAFSGFRLVLDAGNPCCRDA